jgi:hypothetical protein
MSISVFGIIFVPAAIWIFLFQPRYLVALMVLASIFGGSSVVDFSVGGSDFGIQPYFFVGILLAIREFSILLRPREIQPMLRKIAGPLIGFWSWATLSSFVLPVVFQGAQVIDPRSDLGDYAMDFALKGETTTLHWSVANLGQAVYLTLNVVALLYVLSARFDRDRGRPPLGALRVSIAIVAIIALVQAFSVWRGWEFPYSFFNSNPAYAQAIAADFEGVRKVNSTFTEASTAGGFLAASALSLLSVVLSGKAVSRALIFLIVTALILTTATTGYGALFVGIVLLFVYFVDRSRRGLSSRKVLSRFVAVAALLAIAVVALLIIDAPLRGAVLAATVEKGDTYSFLVRSSMDWYSVQLLFKTYGLGVGLGSNRPSSFAAYLLGDVGAIGTAFFVLFVVRLFRQLFEASRKPVAGSFMMVTWMLAGILIAQTIAIPDLNWPPLWAALMVACSVLSSKTGLPAAVLPAEPMADKGPGPIKPALA